MSADNNASHLSQSDSNTADLNQKQISEYWKSKEGKCLACGAPIAVEEQYCPADTAFLIEAHESNNHLT